MQNVAGSVALVVPMPKLVRATVLPAMPVLVGKKIKKSKIKDRLSQTRKPILFMC